MRGSLSAEWVAYFMRARNGNRLFRVILGAAGMALVLFFLATWHYSSLWGQMLQLGIGTLSCSGSSSCLLCVFAGSS